MRKIIILICIISFIEPAFSDIINPTLTNEQRKEIIRRREINYEKRVRINTIYRVCGADFINNEKYTDGKALNRCKADLKKDYEKNIKFIEQYTRGSNYNAFNYL